MLRHTLATNFTDKRPGSSMNWHVSGQVVVCIEDFATLVALENFGLVVDIIA